ncbi:MAG: phospholipase [Roseiflexaceae bacterium]
MQDSPDLPLFTMVERPTVATATPPLAILLHGYGSNEADLYDLASYFDPRLLSLSVRAPLPSGFGFGSYAWFDLAFTYAGNVDIRPEAFDRRQIERSRDLLIALIEQAVQRFHADPQRVFLVGFSQGAAMAAMVALHRPDLVAGAALLSGLVPRALVEPLPAAQAVAGKRFLVAHGVQDTVVPIAQGRATQALMVELGVDLTYREYPAAHTITQPELRDLVDWLRTGIA